MAIFFFLYDLLDEYGDVEIINKGGQIESHHKQTGKGKKMEEMKKIDEVHKAYEICKEVFSPTVGIIEAGSEIEDKEEYEFYKMAHEFFFQKRQKELIAKGIY